MELVTLICEDKHNTPINQTNKTQQHATHTLYDTHQGRKAPAPHSAASVLPHDARRLWELVMHLVRGRVWDIATTCQLNWDQPRYSAEKKHSGNTAVQPSSRHSEVAQVHSRDALHMVRGSTLVKPTVRQSFGHTSNTTLPLARRHYALPRADADDTYPCWGSSEQGKPSLLRQAVSCDRQPMSWLLWPAASGNVSGRGDGFWDTAKPLCPQQHMLNHNRYPVRSFSQSSPSPLRPLWMTGHAWDELN